MSPMSFCPLTKKVGVASVPSFWAALSRCAFRCSSASLIREAPGGRLVSETEFRGDVLELCGTVCALAEVMA
jgi:hypothetical protein